MYWFWFLKFCDFLLVYVVYNIFKFSFCYIKNFMSYHYLGSVWHRGNGSHDLFNVISKVIVFRSFDDSFFHYVDSWTINASQRYDWGLIQSWFQGVIFWARLSTESHMINWFGSVEAARGKSKQLSVNFF